MGAGGVQEICSHGCGLLSRPRSLQGRMAQELGEKELLRMEVEQLKKEVKNPRALVSLLLPSSSLPVPQGPWTGETMGRWGRSRAIEGAGDASGMEWDVEGGRGLTPWRCTGQGLGAWRAPCVRSCFWAGPGPVSLTDQSQALWLWARNSHPSRTCPSLSSLSSRVTVPTLSRSPFSWD